MTQHTTGSRPLRRTAIQMTIYRVFLQRLVRHTNRSDMDHTVLPANYTMPAFPS